MVMFQTSPIGIYIYNIYIYVRIYVIICIHIYIYMNLKALFDIWTPKYATPWSRLASDPRPTCCFSSGRPIIWHQHSPWGENFLCSINYSQLVLPILGKDSVSHDKYTLNDAPLHYYMQFHGLKSYHYLANSSFSGINKMAKQNT